MRRVRGDFGKSDQRPYVVARILLPRLGVFADMDLLVDTGADFTSIHWTDRQRLHDAHGNPLPPDATFSSEGTASGISGSSVTYGIEEAAIFFSTEDNDVQFQVVQARIALDDTAAGIPSLLGRDILSTARLDFNMPAELLVLEWPTES